MFSLYNDRIKSRVLVSDVNGQISEYEYNRSSSSLLDSSEGQQAIDNTNDARDEDDKRTDDLTPNQNANCSMSNNF